MMCVVSVLMTFMIGDYNAVVGGRKHKSIDS